MDRARTLLLFASGMPRRRRVIADSFRHFVPGEIARIAARAPFRYLRAIFTEEYEALSYAVDWRDAFVASDRLDVVSCNVNDTFALAAAGRRIGEFDLVVALHSAAGDSLSQLRRFASDLSRRRGKLLVLFGNEYDDMASKRELLRDVRADYVGTQLPIAAGAWLYEGCGSVVVAAPAGLNPLLYRPATASRPIDIGFRGDQYSSALIGDDERARIIEFFEQEGPRRGLAVDIAFARLPRHYWSAFLASCLGTVGAEAGTYYLERDDVTRDRAARYVAEHPRASLTEVISACYPPRVDRPSGKAISSRHLEAVGTKTCQLLVAGAYNGVLRAREHYIEVRPDLSNIDDAIALFKDDAERSAIVERAYESVLSAHTYAHRVSYLISATLSPS